MNTNSDNTLRVWDTESGQCLHILEGHSSRIWDVSSNDVGTTVASASGDSTVKIWDIKSSKASCRATLSGHSGDVYTVKYHPTSVRDFRDIRVRLNCTWSPPPSTSPLISLPLFATYFTHIEPRGFGRIRQDRETSRLNDRTSSKDIQWTPARGLQSHYQPRRQPHCQWIQGQHYQVLGSCFGRVHQDHIFSFGRSHFCSHELERHASSQQLKRQLEPPLGCPYGTLHEAVFNA